jgi:hypothetical protein
MMANHNDVLFRIEFLVRTRRYIPHGMFLLPSRLAFSSSHGSRTSSKVNFSPCLSMLFTCPALISKSIEKPIIACGCTLEARASRQERELLSFQRDVNRCPNFSFFVLR